jgi:hypothetical protein
LTSASAFISELTLLQHSIMSGLNRDQWGPQPKADNGFSPGPMPGNTPNYIPPPGPPWQGDAGYGVAEKSPYEGDRFKHRRRINDPFFLIFFVLQVIEWLTS